MRIRGILKELKYCFLLFGWILIPFAIAGLIGTGLVMGGLVSFSTLVKIVLGYILVRAILEHGVGLVIRGIKARRRK